MRRLLACFLAFLSLHPAANAQFSFGGSSKPVTRASLIPEVKSVTPGQSFNVALKLEHPDEWHSYYKNSGGVELSPAIHWSVPNGFNIGPIQWPAPQVKNGLAGKSFVYAGSPVFLVTIQVPATLSAGETITLTADATWQICKETCISEKKTFTLTLPVTATAEVDPAQIPLFEAARAALPTQAKNQTITATASGESVVSLRLSAASPAPLDFIPDQPFLAALSDGGKATRDGDAWILTLKRRTTDLLDQPIPQGTSLSGILLTDARAIAIPETRISAASAPAASYQPTSAFLLTLGSLLLGGLILNLMPCVFPVIGLKIMGFVQQSGQDRKKIAFHGLAFTAGVLASFAVISGILFAARAAGSLRGWGYQLQDPWIVLTLMLLMFILALNMYGVFEIGASATSIGGNLQAKQGISGSFFSGVLATVVATPCSAPFLGAAIGVAIALPAAQFFTAFAAMAIGLSLPYLILSLFPQFINFLPRPGKWMESFKQGMSFLLFATAGFLLWIYAGQIGLENLLAPIFGLTAIATAAWIYGRWYLPHLPPSTRTIAVGMTLLFVIGGLFLTKPPKPTKLVWEKWSVERVAQLQQEGKPVYIDFTAQWCATCQVNKKRAYTDEVIALMKQKGVVALKADKTNPNPAIEAELQKLGRSAIPVNVLLVPGKAPIITPELLSAGYLKELFQKELQSPK